MTSAVTVSQPNKYEQALVLFDLAVASRDNSDLLCQRFDDLLVYLKETFTAPKVDDENVQAVAYLLLKETYDPEAIRGIPPGVADTIYPVALFKLGLKTHSFRLDVNKMKQFDWFLETYGQLIVKSADLITSQFKIQRDTHCSPFDRGSADSHWQG